MLKKQQAKKINWRNTSQDQWLLFNKSDFKLSQPGDNEEGKKDNS